MSPGVASSLLPCLVVNGTLPLISPCLVFSSPRGSPTFLRILKAGYSLLIILNLNLSLVRPQHSHIRAELQVELFYIQQSLRVVNSDAYIFDYFPAALYLLKSQSSDLNFVSILSL